MDDKIELINNAVILGHRHNYHKILFDMETAEEATSFIEDYSLNKNLLQITDLTFAHRCAVVFSSSGNIDRNQFYETVAFNWGQGIFKVFFDIEEGLSYLRAIKQHL